MTNNTSTDLQHPAAVAVRHAVLEDVLTPGVGVTASLIHENGINVRLLHGSDRLLVHRPISLPAGEECHQVAFFIR